MPELGETRGLPDGGRQISDGVRWFDTHTPEGRGIAARQAEAVGLIGAPELELALLGCALYDAAETMPLLDGLRPEHFVDGCLGQIFRAILTRWRANETADPYTIGGDLKNHPGLAELGGFQFLADLVDRAPPCARVGDYAAQIKGYATRRALVMAADQIRHEARHDPEGLGVELTDVAEQIIATVSQGAPRRSHWIGGAAMIAEALDAAEARAGRIDYGTGLADLDDALGGFEPGEVALIAGRPGMCKTTAALQLAKANARPRVDGSPGRGVCFYSLEMSGQMLGLRLAADLAFDRFAPIYCGKSSNIHYEDARRGRLDQAQWSRLREAGREIASWPLDFDTFGGVSVSEMTARARRRFLQWKRQGIEPGLVVVDHLGLAKQEQDRKGNRYAEVGDISRALSQVMAKSLGVPVVALCQLTRAVEGRDDKRPKLSDLRDAGNLEEDARQILFLYRPEYYLRPPVGVEDWEEKSKREAEREKVHNKLFWLIEKNSHGAAPAQVETFIDVGCSAIRDRDPGQVERRAA